MGNFHLHIEVENLQKLLVKLGPLQIAFIFHKLKVIFQLAADLSEVRNLLDEVHVVEGFFEYSRKGTVLFSLAAV